MAFNTSISSLSGTSTFYDWFVKENDEIIAKLNQITVSGVTSGDGILAGLSASSGLVTLSIGGTSGNIQAGLTFSGKVSFVGETAVPNVSYKVTGITSGSDGFTFGSVVRITPTGYTTAVASDADSAEVIGVVSSLNPSYSVVTLSGKIEGDFTGVAGGTLSEGCVYFLDPSTRGNITITEPSTVGQVSKPVIIGLGQTAGMVIQYRGNYLNASTSAGGESGTNRLYISFPTSGVPDPRLYGFSAGVFLSYAPDVLGASGISYFHKYLQDTGRTSLNNGWFISGSKNQAYRLYDFGSPFLNIPWEEDYIVGMVESITTTGTNLIYQILARGTTSVIPRSISTFAKNKTGFWCLSGATFNPTGLSGGQLSQNTLASQNDPYAPVYQVGFVYSSSPTSWYVNPRPLTDTPNTIYKAAQLPENLTNGLNFAYNGDFSIWQRGTGRDSAYTTADNVYFADNWIRRMSGITGVQSLQRQSFSLAQTDVEGYPRYYISIKALTDPTSTTPVNSVYSVGHVIENFDTFHSAPITVSLYAKCAQPNYSADVYFARYNNGSLVSKTVIGSLSLKTTWTKHTINYTTGKQPAGTPNDDYIEIGVELNPLINKGWTAGVPTGTNTTVDIASMVVYFGTYASPPHNFIPDSDKLIRSQKYYYQTYIDTQLPARGTMLDITQPVLNTFTFTHLPNSAFGLLKLPVQMREDPSVSLYSPLDGMTAEMYNYTANANLRNTSGTDGYNGEIRKPPFPTGTPTVSASADKTTVRVNINGGSVPFDIISGHIIADASYPI